MIEVEVLIDDFKDLEIYNKKVKVRRNSQELELQFKLLQKGDIYSISKERYALLSKKGIVAKVKKDSKAENKED